MAVLPGVAAALLCIAHYVAADNWDASTQAASTQNAWSNRFPWLIFRPRDDVEQLAPGEYRIPAPSQRIQDAFRPSQDNSRQCFGSGVLLGKVLFGILGPDRFNSLISNVEMQMLRRPETRGSGTDDATRSPPVSDVPAPLARRFRGVFNVPKIVPSPAKIMEDMAGTIIEGVIGSLHEEIGKGIRNLFGKR